MGSKKKKILTNVIGTISYNLLLVLNLAVITQNLDPDSFTNFTFVAVASGFGAVIFGAGIPAWMSIILAEPVKTAAQQARVARAPCAIILLQCLAGLVALLAVLYVESTEEIKVIISIFLLQMAMTISFMADGVAIGLASVRFLNLRRLIPDTLFLGYLAWCSLVGGNYQQVTEAYVSCWIITALISTPFVVSRIGVTFQLDRNLWVLVWKASAYLQWALAQAATQRGAMLLAASYGTYETVVLFRWAQIIATTASHAYNAVAQVAFPLQKARDGGARISLMAALNFPDLRASSKLALSALASVILTAAYYLAIAVTSNISVSVCQGAVFVVFSMATIGYLFSATEANWRGFRIQYLLSQYITLAVALLILVFQVIFSGAGLELTNVASLLAALAAGKIGGLLFLKTSRHIKGAYLRD